MKAVEVRELVKDYGNLRAIKGISFEVNEGEIFGLIGPNGAGKTTALRTIATLLQITSGSITVFGYELPKEAGEVRKIISYGLIYLTNLCGSDFLDYRVS
jgi:ABC-2 type transport system ATP-binding protein